MNYWKTGHLLVSFTFSRLSWDYIHLCMCVYIYFCFFHSWAWLIVGDRCDLCSPFLLSRRAFLDVIFLTVRISWKPNTGRTI